MVMFTQMPELLCISHISCSSPVVDDLISITESKSKRMENVPVLNLKDYCV